MSASDDEIDAIMRTIVQPALDREDTTLLRVRGRSHDPAAHRAKRSIAHGLEARGWTRTDIGDFLHRDHTTICNLLGSLRRNSTEYAAGEQIYGTVDQVIRHIERGHAHVVSRRGAEMMIAEIRRLRVEVDNRCP